MTNTRPERISSERGPTLEEYDAYFARLEAKVWKHEIALLREEPFRAEGNGWHMGENGMMQALMAREIADLAGFSRQDKKLFDQAALLNSPMRRIQYQGIDREDLKFPAFKSATITTDQRADLDEAGGRILQKEGFDRKVIEVARAGSTRFPKEYASGALKTDDREKQHLVTLTKWMHYIHNSVITPVGDARKDKRSDIGGWRSHLLQAAQSYMNIAKETVLVDGEQVPYFDVEAMICEEAEAELRKEILEKNPGIVLGPDGSLHEFLRQRVKEKMAAGELPRKLKRW